MGLNTFLTEEGLEYKDVAPFVGLDPVRKLGDAPSFDLHRSRIPSALFRSTLMDMDVLLIQYGTLRDQATEEATSRFLSPVSILPINAWTNIV